jgi:hypothetical protein
MIKEALKNTLILLPMNQSISTFLETILPTAFTTEGEQEKHGLLFKWPRRTRGPFPCERMEPFDNDTERFSCLPTLSATPGRLFNRKTAELRTRTSLQRCLCIRSYRSPMGSEVPWLSLVKRACGRRAEVTPAHELPPLCEGCLTLGA